MIHHWRSLQTCHCYQGLCTIELQCTLANLWQGLILKTLSVIMAQTLPYTETQCNGMLLYLSEYWIYCQWSNFGWNEHVSNRNWFKYYPGRISNILNSLQSNTMMCHLFTPCYRQFNGWGGIKQCVNLYLYAITAHL